jgi:hypothetical protein
LSVIEDLRSAQQQALTRLNELEPLVAEYEELQREVKRLGLTNGEGRRARRRSAAPAGGDGVTKASGRASKRVAAAAPGGRADDIARLVARQPGVTVAELARTLDVDATSLYRPVRRLIGEGRLRKDGTALHPVAG